MNNMNMSQSTVLSKRSKLMLCDFGDKKKQNQFTFATIGKETTQSKFKVSLGYSLRPLPKIKQSICIYIHTRI